MIITPTCKNSAQPLPTPPPSQSGSGSGMASNTMFWDKYVASLNTASNTANGQIRWNTAQQSNATQLYISERSDNNIDLSNVFNSISIKPEQPAYIYVQQSVDGNQYVKFRITKITDNGTSFTLDVTPVSVHGAWPVGGNTQMLIVLQV